MSSDDRTLLARATRGEGDAEVGAAATRIEMPGEMKARLRRFLSDHLRGS